jgi:hypothetical protein
MTISCPRCGQAGCDETVISFVTVWASCARCHYVWRSSLFETVVGYAARGVGFSKGDKARGNAPQPGGNQQANVSNDSLKPASTDRVAEWLDTQENAAGAPRMSATLRSAPEAEKVEQMFDLLDPVTKADASPVAARATAPREDNDFYAFFAEVAEEAKAPAAVEPIEAIATVAPDSEDDADAQAMMSMDELYEAFKRLEEQLDTISDSLQTYTQRP